MCSFKNVFLYMIKLFDAYFLYFTLKFEVGKKKKKFWNLVTCCVKGWKTKVSNIVGFSEDMKNIFTFIWDLINWCLLLNYYILKEPWIVIVLINMRHWMKEAITLLYSNITITITFP